MTFRVPGATPSADPFMGISEDSKERSIPEDLFAETVGDWSFGGEVPPPTGSRGEPFLFEPVFLGFEEEEKEEPVARPEQVPLQTSEEPCPNELAIEMLRRVERNILKEGLAPHQKEYKEVLQKTLQQLVSNIYILAPFLRDKTTYESLIEELKLLESLLKRPSSTKEEIAIRQNYIQCYFSRLQQQFIGLRVNWLSKETLGEMDSIEKVAYVLQICQEHVSCIREAIEKQKKKRKEEREASGAPHRLTRTKLPRTAVPRASDPILTVEGREWTKQTWFVHATGSFSRSKKPKDLVTCRSIITILYEGRTLDVAKKDVEWYGSNALSRELQNGSNGASSSSSDLPGVEAWRKMLEEFPAEGETLQEIAEKASILKGKLSEQRLSREEYGEFRMESAKLVLQSIIVYWRSKGYNDLFIEETLSPFCWDIDPEEGWIPEWRQVL